MRILTYAFSHIYIYIYLVCKKAVVAVVCGSTPCKPHEGHVQNCALATASLKKRSPNIIKSVVNLPHKEKILCAPCLGVLRISFCAYVICWQNPYTFPSAAPSVGDSCKSEAFILRKRADFSPMVLTTVFLPLSVIISFLFANSLKSLAFVTGK